MTCSAFSCLAPVLPGSGAVGAGRRLHEIGRGPEVEIVVINRTAWHSIRVRNYEADLTPTRIPLEEVLDPIGVKHIVAEVTEIDAAQRVVGFSTYGGMGSLTYDRLVFALGSRLVRPPIPGLAEYGFDVDTRPVRASIITSLCSRPANPLPANIPSLWSAAGSPASRSRPKCPASSALLCLMLRLSTAGPHLGSFSPIGSLGSAPTWAGAPGR